MEAEQPTESPTLNQTPTVGGVKVAEGTSDELKSSVGSSTLHLRLANKDDVPDAAEIVGRLLSEEPVLTPESGGMNVPLADADQTAAREFLQRSANRVAVDAEAGGEFGFGWHVTSPLHVEPRATGRRTPRRVAFDGASGTGRPARSAPTLTLPRRTGRGDRACRWWIIVEYH